MFLFYIQVCHTVEEKKMGQNLSIKEHAMVAIHDDDVRDLMYYVNKGIDIYSISGQAMLLYAATQGATSCANYLVCQGVNPFKKTNGLSFYEYAVQYNNAELLATAQRWVPPRLQRVQRR